MKKAFILVSFFSILFSVSSHAQLVVKMKKAGTSYFIAGTVNGAKQNLLFDNNTKGVSISPSTVLSLVGVHALSMSDLVGVNGGAASATFPVGTRMKLKSITMKGLTLNNVVATIENVPGSYIVIGKSVINVIGKTEMSADGKSISIANGNKNTFDFSSTAEYKFIQFSTLPSGLKYQLVLSNAGTKAKVSDVIKMNMIYCTENDSVLFSTYDEGVGAIQLPCQAPTFNGDAMEGFCLLTKGDSAIFLMSYDSLYKGQPQKPVFATNGGFLKLKVKVIDLMTKEEYDAYQTAASAAQVKIDEDVILKYCKDHMLTPQKTASGLYYVVEKQGDGEKTAAGKKVTVNYTGMTTDGEIFDSNTDPKFGHVQPFDFTLGQGQVIKGWDEGLLLFNVGGKGKLLIPSGLGYGAQGAGGKIPGNAVLLFDVEVVGQK